MRLGILWCLMGRHDYVLKTEGVRVYWLCRRCDKVVLPWMKDAPSKGAV